MRISCIIPAYNESGRISKVLDVVCRHPKIDEVIVVDDASTDGTAEVAERYAGPARTLIVKKKKNGGKTKAVHDGIQLSTGDHLLFIDADLVGLDAADIDLLIDPVAGGIADMSISLRKNSPWVWLGLDYISGERLVPKKIFDGHLTELYTLRNFGLEVYMNRLIIKSRLRIRVAYWGNVISPLKYSKAGFWGGLRGDAKMMRDIFRTASVFEIIAQIWTMLRLRV